MDPIDALVDWDLARATARRAVARVGPGLRVQPDEAAEVVSDLHRLAAQARAHVAEVSGLCAAVPAPVRVLDRAAWAEATVDAMRGLFTPLAEGLRQHETSTPQAMRAVTGLARRVLGAEVGAMVALLSGRVIGQYEPISGQLLLVAPNVVAAERALGMPAQEFRMWVCLHEQTHALQFTGVPWLHDHFLHLLAQLGTELKVDPRSMIHRVREAITARDDLPVLATILAGPSQRLVLEDIQSLMTVLEGHAEHVMDVAGAGLLPSLGRMRGKLDERRRSPGGPVSWLVRRLLGVDAKLAQYARGKDFCDEVSRRSGESGLSTVWESAGALPSRAEIADPPRWLTRVLGTPASV